MIFRFHCAWLAVDSFISAAKLSGETTGAAVPFDLLSQTHLSLWMDLFSLDCI